MIMQFYNNRAFFLVFVIFFFFLSVSYRGYSTGEIYSDSDKKTIKVGFYENPPKIYKDSKGKINGYHIEIIEEIAKDENWELVYVEGSWQEGLDRLKKGEIDIFPDVAYSLERGEEYDFNSETVLLNWAVVYTDSDSTVNSITDLNRKKVATMKNSIHTNGENGIINYAKSFNIQCEFVYAEDYSKCLEMLDKKEVQAAVVNRLFGLANQELYDCKRTSIIFNPSHIKFAFTKGALHNPYLIERIDKRISDFKSNQKSVLFYAFDKYLAKSIKKEKLNRKNILKTVVLISLLLFFFASAVLFVVFSLKNKSYNFSKYVRTNPSMAKIRDDIVDSSLVTFTIFSLPMTLSVLYSGLSGKWDNFIFFYVFMTFILIFALIFIRKIPTSIKLFILVFVFFICGILTLKTWGRIGVGSVFFLAGSIIVSILHGKEKGFATLFAGFFITIIFSFLSSINVFHINNSIQL